MRQTILFDEGWLFHKGDIERKRPPLKGPIYSSAKTERERWGAAAVAYNDSSDDYRPGVEFCCDKWEKVDLPHDYVITGTFCEEENNTLGYLNYGNAWYRKHFKLEESDRDKRLVLVFDAVATESTIYCNGCPLKHNFSGYNSFPVDITDFVKFGEDNVLAVYVTTKHHESWWYEGGGIYRHVWLQKTDPVHIALWGVYTKPVFQHDNVWHIDIQTEIENQSYEDTVIRAVSIIRDREGNICAEAFCTAACALQETTTLTYTAELSDTQRWDPDDPYLYTCETTLYRNDEPIDSTTTRFGCRTFLCDPDKGLFVNDKPVKIKGLCGHYDCGLVGKAVPNNIFRHKVRMMQEMGANGYRTSHYPQATALMDALDEAGFIVFDETRWFSSDEESMEALRMLIKRDRNHPSVFFWSIGNEEPIFTKEQGRRIAKAMMAQVRKLDDTRPVTAACDRPDNALVYDDFDVIGINYGLQHYEKVHEKFPDKAIFSSENCATGTTRGWYFDDDPSQGYINAMDKDTNSWFRSRKDTWQFIMEREWVMGGYQWIGFEHRGETVWPRLCSQSGAIDLFLQKKDAFWQNQSYWTDKPMIHLLPHWNHSGREGEILPVRAYTNCECAELYVNGVSAGKLDIEKYGYAEWKVPYAPGIIEVIGYSNGTEACRDSHETTGKPVRLKLISENLCDCTANGQDIALFTCVVLDDAGREIPDGAVMVHFTCNALGTIVGTGSDISDHAPLCSRERQMRAGKISVAVRLGKAHGTLRLYAENPYLENGSISIEI